MWRDQRGLMIVPPIVMLIGATTLLRMVFAATTGLGVDESYMVTAGRVLRLGYFDHPPAAWWLSWGAAHLFGTEAPLVVRLPFILLFALSQALVWRIGCVIATRRAGFWAAVALNVSPVFGVTTGSWVLPDGPLDAALLGAVLCLLLALPASGRRALTWWAGAGICAGLALFSKYSGALVIGGGFLYLASSRTHRFWLRRPEPYVALLLAAAVFSPVVAWNALHDWASFAFQGDRAAGGRFQPLMPLTTLAGEALFVAPWIWLPMMILWVSAFRNPAPWSHRLLAWLAAPPIVVFALIAGWSNHRILYHWAAPGYLMLFPLLGEAIAARIGQPAVRRLMGGSAALVVVAMIVVATDIQTDIPGRALAAVLRSDPTVEGVDWSSIGVDLRARGLLRPGTVVAALNWRDAGKIGYALGDDVTTICLNEDRRQFGLAYPLQNFNGRNMLVFVVAPRPNQLLDAARWFAAATPAAATSIRIRGRVLRPVSVLLGTGFRPGSR